MASLLPTSAERNFDFDRLGATANAHFDFVARLVLAQGGFEIFENRDFVVAEFGQHIAPFDAGFVALYRSSLRRSG